MSIIHGYVIYLLLFYADVAEPNAMFIGVLVAIFSARNHIINEVRGLLNARNR